MCERLFRKDQRRYVGFGTIKPDGVDPRQDIPIFTLQETFYSAMCQPFQYPEHSGS